MAQFRRVSASSFIYQTPQDMFADYKTSQINALYGWQSSLLESYMTNGYQIADLSIEMPTGSGKTLIGLLIGEFRRRKNGEKVVYLCANNLLARQAYQHSKQYGFEASLFTGPKRSYLPESISAYQSASCLAVTSYSSLFNSNSFFDNADILIFDDAHAAEEYISSNWTLSIPSEDPLYTNIMQLIKPYFPMGTYDRLLLNNGSTAIRNSVEILPGIYFDKYEDSIRKAIEDYFVANPDSDLRFSWGMIRDNLSACNVYASQSSIDIRPYIPPTLCFPPFRHAKQRIYMSATLGESGELERSFGVPSITSLPTAGEWGTRTTGRRLFLFPSASFGVEHREDVVVKLVNKANRSIILTNSKEKGRRCADLLNRRTNKEIYSAKDLEPGKDCFITSENAVAILANRLDGIDFPNDECRVEILLELPTATHVQERFFVQTVNARQLYEERLRTRLVQSLGRCTRSQTDYAVICILSDEANSLAISPGEASNLNPELQAEIVFGLQNATDQTDLDDYLELVDIFLYERSKWATPEQDILALRDNIAERVGDSDAQSPERSRLRESCGSEVNASYALWNQHYADALTEIDKTINRLNIKELNSYCSYWCYIAACCAQRLLYQTSSNEFKKMRDDYIDRAISKSFSSSWLSGLSSVTLKDPSSLEREEIVMRIEENIRGKLKTTDMNGILLHLDELIQALRNSEGIDFEKRHCELGEWLGYRSINPKGDSEPDPIWIVDNNLCVVAEDKLYKNDLKAIPVKHVRQAAGHRNWILAHREQLGLSSSFSCMTIFVTNAGKLAVNAGAQADEIFYVNHDDFLEWASKAIDVLKSAVTTYSEPNNPIWRNRLCTELNKTRTSTYFFVDFIKKKRLRNLKEERG